MKTIFREYLKELRENRKLTIRQVETYSGVSCSYLSQVETGKRGKPSPMILKKLAPVYKVPYLELMKAAGYLDDEVIDGAAHEMNYDNKNYNKEISPEAEKRIEEIVIRSIEKHTKKGR